MQPIPLPNYQLTDAALEANASILAVMVMTHPVAAQFGADTVAALAAISERCPPSVSCAERHFLRDALALVEQAEIAASREAVG